MDLAYFEWVLGLSTAGASCSATRIVPLLVGAEAHAQLIVTPEQAWGILQLKRNFVAEQNMGRSMSPAPRSYSGLPPTGYSSPNPISPSPAIEVRDRSHDDPER